MVFRNKRIWGLMYLINFALALFAALPVSGWLGQSVKHSLALGRSQSGFDYTFLSEMYRNFEEPINAILNQTVLFTILFTLASVFMVAGVLTILKKDRESFSLTTFLRGGSKYFWRLLRLTFYFLIVQAVVFAFFMMIFFILCDGLNPFAMESDQQLVDTARLIGPIYMLCFVFVAMIQDYGKIHMVHQDPNLLFQTFWGSFKLVFKNLGKFSLLYLMNILTFLAVLGVYWKLSESFDRMTMSSIMLFFILGQIFIVARIAIKLLNLSSATYLYRWTREGYAK